MDASSRPLNIRSATAGALPAVVAIYNAGIAERVAIFETDPRTEHDLAGRATDGQPFVVAEQAGKVVGFARAGSYSDRCVYQGVGEHAVYVHPTPADKHSAASCLRPSAPSPNATASTPIPVAPLTTPAGLQKSAFNAATDASTGNWNDCVLVERLLGDAANS